MAETFTAAQSQPKRKTQRCCGYEALPALRQTEKMNIWNYPGTNVF